MPTTPLICMCSSFVLIAFPLNMQFIISIKSVKIGNKRIKPSILCQSLYFAVFSASVFDFSNGGDFAKNETSNRRKCKESKKKSHNLLMKHKVLIRNHAAEVLNMYLRPCSLYQISHFFVTKLTATNILFEINFRMV